MLQILAEIGGTYILCTTVLRPLHNYLWCCRATSAPPAVQLVTSAFQFTKVGVRIPEKQKKTFFVFVFLYSSVAESAKSVGKQTPMKFDEFREGALNQTRDKSPRQMYEPGGERGDALEAR